MQTSEQIVPSQFKVYPKRWAILCTVALLNISNGATWISFFPVASTTANFFEKSSSAINWFSFVFFIVPMLLFFPTTYLSNRVGLLFLVQFGSAFNVAGAVIKSFGVSGLINEKDKQYIVCLLGQTVAAVSQTFVIYVPTKVSNAWFPKAERGIATIVLSLSYSFGLTLTQFTTPLYVKDVEDIPTLVYVCLGLATIVQVFSLAFMTSSNPKTPPSVSAENKLKTDVSYIQQLRQVFSSVNFVILLLMLSCGVGYISGLNTLTQQIICNVGYSDNFAGECIAIMYCSGYIASVGLIRIFNRYENWETLLKPLGAITSISFVVICEFLIVPDRTVLLGSAFAIFGIFGVGTFPIGLEMSVELTYPVDESIPTGLVYFFGQLFALIFIIVTSSLAIEVPYNSHNSCDLDSTDNTLDYSISVCVVMATFCGVFITLIAFFKPVYKRRYFEKFRKQQLEKTPT